MNINKSLRIFITDDDPMCREMYRQYVLNMGFLDVSVFDNSQSCINALGQQPDIIILDHQMIPFDGLETLKRIKKLNPGIYVICVSSQELEQTKMDAFGHGAYAYIVKGEHEEERLSSSINEITAIMTELKTSHKPGRLLLL